MLDYVNCTELCNIIKRPNQTTLSPSALTCYPNHTSGQVLSTKFWCRSTNWQSKKQMRNCVLAKRRSRGNSRAMMVAFRFCTNPLLTLAWRPHSFPQRSTETSYYKSRSTNCKSRSRETRMKSKHCNRYCTTYPEGQTAPHDKTLDSSGESTTIHWNKMYLQVPISTRQVLLIWGALPVVEKLWNLSNIACWIWVCCSWSQESQGQQTS